MLPYHAYYIVPYLKRPFKDQVYSESVSCEDHFLIFLPTVFVTVLFSRNTNVIFFLLCCLLFAVFSRAAQTLLWVTFKPNWINETDCFGAPRYCLLHTHTHTHTITPRGVYQHSGCSTFHSFFFLCSQKLPLWHCTGLLIQSLSVALLPVCMFTAAVATGLSEGQASHWLKLSVSIELIVRWGWADWLIQVDVRWPGAGRITETESRLIYELSIKSIFMLKD